jgi:hypothetical protein
MNRFTNWLIYDVALRREPDVIIGGREDPYLLRWYLTPWRRWPGQAEKNPTRWNRVKAAVARILPNIYLHQFLRDDDDRALHDHPWPWCSILLRGEYIEHTIAAGGIHYRRLRKAGSVKFSLPSRAHRIELLRDQFGALYCWTLFGTGPRVREWGFHCPERGWVHWRDFVASDDPGAVGPGCGEP